MFILVLNKSLRVGIIPPVLRIRIRCLFDPWIRDPEQVFSGSRISDPESRIPNPYFFTCLLLLFLDPGSEIQDPGWVKIRIRDPG
jgi:hypothetical protein